MLSGVGGLFGVAIGAWGSRALVRLAAGGESWRLPLDTDWRVIGFAAVLSIVTTCVFGLTPALKATLRPSTLQTGLRTRGGPESSRRVAKGFVVAQVAISLLLVAGASLLGRSFWNLTHQDFGYQQDGVLLVRLPFDLANFKLTRDPAFSEALDQRMNALPGALSAALAGAGPLGAMQRPGKSRFPSGLR